jgi:hypothetical protein
MKYLFSDAFMSSFSVSGLGSVYDSLTSFANLSNFWTLFDTAFGSSYDFATAASLRSQWQAQDFSQFPTIEVVSSDILGNANGAYASSTNKIYLSDSFITSASQQSLEAVILEEFGHFVDAQVNQTDTAGDEGELFSAIVRGVSLSSTELSRIKTENDQAIIVVNGEAISIEQSTITLTVTTRFDENDGTSSGAGLSLRDAIIIANNDINNDYIINLASGETYFLTQGLAGEDNGLAGDLDIKNGANITIRTNGSSPATINASTILNGGDRVFHVMSGGALTLNMVVVTGGRVNHSGGGIFTEFGTLNVFRSTISGNSSLLGGGIYTRFGTTQIISSTISGNSSEGDGGGIFNDRTNLTISNSTISGNSSKDDGGGILASGNTLLVNATVTNNTADADNNGGGNGGGISSSRSVAFALRNTIVTGNFDTPNNNGSGTKNPDIAGSVQGNANNLIGSLTGASGTVGTGSDIVLASGQSAGLGTLANNGGITQTHALLTGSPAINAGLTVLIGTDLSDSDGDANLTELMPNDQRGVSYKRVSGSSVDIGAFEAFEASATNDDVASYGSKLTTPIIRFRNNDKPGTYLFAGEQEATSIRQNNKNFVEEGIAFPVAVSKTDPLMQPFYRFKNTDKGREGTYLFAGEQEAASIRTSYKNFVEEGLAFYAFPAGVGGGTTDFMRFQNKSLPGTYLFTGPSETKSVLTNPGFILEGSAFSAGG